MKTGTCHFPSYDAALLYYHPYLPGATPARLRAFVEQKLNEKEIAIGQPALKPGETLTIEDNRYFISDPKP